MGYFNFNDDSFHETDEIIVNAAECVLCGHVLRSWHVHDYRTHSCQKSIWFMVDGGRDYIRRGWKGNTAPADHYIERSVTSLKGTYANCLKGLA